MVITDKAETRDLRWKAHDAAQLVTAMQVRKVREKMSEVMGEREGARKKTSNR